MLTSVASRSKFPTLEECLQNPETEAMWIQDKDI